MSVDDYLLLQSVHGGHIEFSDYSDGVRRCQLTFYGYRLDGRRDRVCVITDRNGAAAIITGLRNMFAEHGELAELEQQVAANKVDDRRIWP